MILIDSVYIAINQSDLDQCMCDEFKDRYQQRTHIALCAFIWLEYQSHADF